MTGSENITRSIEFRSPERLSVTVECNVDNLFEKNEAKASRIKTLQSRIPDDTMRWLGIWKEKTEKVTQDGKTRWLDEWSVGWVAWGLGHFAEGRPLEEGFHKLATYEFPDPLRPGRFDEDDKKLQDRRGRYARPQVWYTILERLWMLRGFDNILMDPYTDLANFERLRDRLVEIDLAMVDLWLPRKPEGIIFSDDWGTQRGMIISPDDWRRLYKPSYAKLFRRVRDGGAHVWMHSCGNILPIIGDLVDIGLSVLNPIQSQAMDVRVLAREFAGRLCFNGGINSQGAMIFGSPEEVAREVHTMVELFGSRGGGYIADTSQTIMMETPLDNLIALYETLLVYA